MFKESRVEWIFPAIEQGVLERWRKENTFERSIENRNDAPEYLFYDGPLLPQGYRIMVIS